MCLGPQTKTRGNGLSGTLLAKWIDGSIILSNDLRQMGCVQNNPFFAMQCLFSGTTATLATHSSCPRVCLGEFGTSLGHLVFLLLIENDLQCVSVKSPSL